MRRELLDVVRVEDIGPYRLLRLKRGRLESGIPGQFFMLAPPGRLLPRPMSLSLATRTELGFLIDPVGPGTKALTGVVRGERLNVLGPLGNGFRLDVERPLLVGGGIGVAPFPYLSERLGRPPAVLGFRSEAHAEAAALVPNAEVVVEPRLVTEAMPKGHDVLACGPEPMLRAVADLAPGAQLAWEAPMACGYGACYGCAVEIGGELKRLCVEGPVLERRRVILNASGCLDALTAPEVAQSLDAFVTKTVTPLPREGNQPVRIAETDLGMLNSIGLANPGIDVLPRRHASAPPRSWGIRVGICRRVRSAGVRRPLRAARRQARRSDRIERLVPERLLAGGRGGGDRRGRASGDHEDALRQALALGPGCRRPPQRLRRERVRTGSRS